MSDSLWPHRRQPTRFPHPWDSPGKNTGVSFHFLLQCMKVKTESEVPQSCPTLSNPMDCSPPGSSTHDFTGKSTDPSRCEILAYCGFHLNIPSYYWSSAFFHVLISYLYVLFKKCLYSPPPIHFLTIFFLPFCCWDLEIIFIYSGW